MPLSGWQPPHGGGEAPREVGAAVDDRHREDRQPDVGREVRGDDADTGRLTGVDQNPATRIVDGLQVDVS